MPGASIIGGGSTRSATRTGPEPYYLLLRRDGRPVAREEFAARVAALLGVASREPPRDLGPDTHLVFLIGHYQDFVLAQPYWDALPPSATSAIVRVGPLRTMDDRRLKAVLAYLRSRGIDHRPVESVRDVDWDAVAAPRRALVAATESTANASHLVNSAFVLAARAPGIGPSRSSTASGRTRTSMSRSRSWPTTS